MLLNFKEPQLNNFTTELLVLEKKKGTGTRDDSRLRVYAYFYYMAVGAGLNPD